MAHIERGNQRQYFSNQLSGNEVSEGIKQVSETLAGTFNSSQDIVNKANEAKLANNQIDLSSEFFKKNTEINTKYQGDPTNPEREKELSEAFDDLANKYEINPLCQAQWSQIKNNVYNNFKQYNAQWQVKQQQTNATNDLKNGYESLTNQVSMLGLNGAGIDEVRLVYKNGIQGLSGGASVVLGSEVANQFLKDSDHDFMATYISSLAMNNPLEAQRLMKDKGVLNDIGQAETIDKLNQYISTSLMNQNKQVAVQEIGNTLRNMNSSDAKNILEGRANLNQVTKFIEQNKNLPEGSKDLILDIYGIGSKTEYYYDRDKKKITKEPFGGTKGRSSKVPVAKMSALEKQLCGESLEAELHDLICFSTENLNSPEMNVKNIKKNGTQKDASAFSVGYMKRIASMQGAIDSAYRAGVITKAQRDNYTNSYIAPVTDYLESNLKQLDEGTWKGMGTKLGYDRIAKRFNTEGLKGESLNTMRRQKLFAQNYYLDELNKVVAKTPNLKSIYDIESLPSRQQQEIYKVASDNALKRAKRWTDKPEYFFAKEYPTVYSQPYAFFNKQDALAVTRVVAEATYKRAFEDAGGNSTLDLQDFAKNKMITEINNQAKRNRLKASKTLDLKDTEMYMSNPAPKNINEFYQRVKALGVTPEQFMKDARARGFLDVMKPTTVKQALINANNTVLGNNNSMAGYYYALQQAEHAKALQEAKKRK